MKGGDAVLSRINRDGSKKFTSRALSHSLFYSCDYGGRDERKKAQKSTEMQHQIGSGSSKDVPNPLNLPGRR